MHIKAHLFIIVFVNLCVTCRFVLFYYRIHSALLREQLETSSHRGCLILRDVSSMETKINIQETTKHHLTSGDCADDVNILDVIETCHGVRPFLLSDYYIDRRPEISGTQICTYFYTIFGTINKNVFFRLHDFR